MLREFLPFKCACSSSLFSLLTEPLDCQFTEQTDSVLFVHCCEHSANFETRDCLSLYPSLATLALRVLICEIGLITAPSSLGGCGLSSLSYKTHRDLLFSLRPSPLPLTSQFPSMLSFSLMLPSSPDIYFAYSFCSFPVSAIPSPVKCELQEDRDLTTFLTILCFSTVLVKAVLKRLSISCW